MLVIFSKIFLLVIDIEEYKILKLVLVYYGDKKLDSWMKVGFVLKVVYK